jgi:hypothetical protein
MNGALVTEAELQKARAQGDVRRRILLSSAPEPDVVREPREQEQPVRVVDYKHYMPPPPVDARRVTSSVEIMLDKRAKVSIELGYPAAECLENFMPARKQLRDRLDAALTQARAGFLEDSAEVARLRGLRDQSAGVSGAVAEAAAKLQKAETVYAEAKQGADAKILVSACDKVSAAQAVLDSRRALADKVKVDVEAAERIALDGLREALRQAALAFANEIRGEWERINARLADELLEAAAAVGAYEAVLKTDLVQSGRLAIGPHARFDA